jgi:DNA transformation protein and related proteins
MADEALRDFVLSQLSELPGVSSRPMFGGHGLYLDGRFFGVISDGRLYFRTDEASRQRYLERGMPALQPKHRPRGPRTVDRNFEVPAAVLEDAAELVEWARQAAGS